MYGFYGGPVEHERTRPSRFTGHTNDNLAETTHQPHITALLQDCYERT